MVFDPNSRTFVPKARLATQSTQATSSASSKEELVYDPNSRSFKPKAQLAQLDAALQPKKPTPQPVPAPIEKKQQMAGPVTSVVKSGMSPPAQNTIRASLVSSRPTSPKLYKSPSLVREEPDAERAAESTTPISTSRNTVDRAKSSRPTAVQTPVHKRSASLEVPAGGRGRVPSQSPNRSAHFSASPVVIAERHVPPPRDVSPAKSAMKHSPAPSLRAGSPMLNYSGVTGLKTLRSPSITSETPSLASQDGSSTNKKKKSVRMSFDEQSRDAPTGQATPATNTSSQSGDGDSDMMTARPALPNFGSVRRDRAQPESTYKEVELSPAQNGASSDHALSSILQTHAPHLPPEVTSKEGTGYVSDASSEAEVPAAGTYLNFNPNATEAKPEEVEKADPASDKQIGSGQEDQAESKVSKDISHANETTKDAHLPAINLMPPTPGVEDGVSKELSKRDASSTAPTSQSALNRYSMEGIRVPGSFTADEESTKNQSERAVPDLSATQATHSSEQSVPGDSISGDMDTQEPGSTATVTPTDLPQPTSPLSDIEEDSDRSAAFSDAYEDASDIEDSDDDRGFASLNAIVSSPVSPPAGTKTIDLLPGTPDSPSAVAAQKKDAEVKGGDWDEATSYWSQLSKAKRAEIENQHLPADEEARTVAAASRNSTSKKPRATAKSTIAERQGQAAQQSQEPIMKKTMRAQPGPTPTSNPEDATHMRQSMRSDRGMATSLRDNRTQHKRGQSEQMPASEAIQTNSTRPVSSSAVLAAQTAPPMPKAATQAPLAGRKSPEPDSTRPAMQRASSSQVSQPGSPKPRARKLQKELPPQLDLYESDSESSFRKRRRARAKADGGEGSTISMKRSMRAAPKDQSASTRASEARPISPDPGGREKRSFGSRTLSPSRGSLFGRNKGEDARAGSQSGPKTTLRDSSTARAAPTKTSSTAPQLPKPPKFSSRFADSDDEDGFMGSKSHWSRFVDSDDDEPASPMVASTKLTPVRGIPKRRGQEDGDSTELEGENDGNYARRSKGAMPIVPAPGDIEKAMAAARRNLGMSEEPALKNGEGGALQQGSLRVPETKNDDPQRLSTNGEATPPDKKRRGFMGLRRNRDSTSSVQQVARPGAPGSPAMTPAHIRPQQTSNQELPSTPTSPPRGTSFNKIPNQSSPAADYKVPDTELNTWQRPNGGKRTVSGISTTSMPAQTAPPRSSSRLRRSMRSESQQRPTTSDGAPVKMPRTMRTDATTTSNTSGVAAQSEREGSEISEQGPNKAVYSQRTGKKKKFGMLRKAFGLND